MFQDNTQFLAAIKNSIETFDLDLAQMIVLSSLSKDVKHFHRMLYLAGHLQNLRAIESDTFTAADLAIIESTNLQLISAYRDKENLAS